MFGKNYDKEIKELSELMLAQSENMKNLCKQRNEMADWISTLRDQMIEIAKIQAQHKASITFLLNHCTVDEGAKEDFFKLLEEIKDTEDLVKKQRRRK